MYHRGVEQQFAHVATHGLGLTLRHAEEHFELDAVLHSARAGQQPGIGNVEEVVARDAHPHVRDAIGVQGVVHDALVVGVRVLLGRPGRQRPVVQRRLNLLHGQVRTLDETHLNSGATLRTASGGPLLQANHGRQRVGQVGLQHNACFEVDKLGLLENARKDRDCHFEIFVLLHIEVDKFGDGGCCGAREQWSEAFHHMLDGFVERPGGVRGHRGRDLDRHVVDVVAAEEGVGSLEATGGFLLSQHGLAEQVDVESDAFGTHLCDRGAELRGGRVHHQVSHHLAENLARNRHHHRGQHRGGNPTTAHGGLHVPGEEGGHTRCEQGEVASGDNEVFRAHNSVDKPHGEVESGRVFQHTRELLRGGVGGNGGCFGEPVAHERNNLVRQHTGRPGGGERCAVERRRGVRLRIEGGRSRCAGVHGCP